jgi:ubiquinone/menaquinone biosynthesis C-methylase UbiE
MKSDDVRRFDRTADGYLRWWAPMLAPAGVRLVDRLERLDPGLTGEPARDVLDLGCGTGNLLFEAARRWPFARLVGVDASVGMLEVARREGARLPESVQARIRLLESDAATLPVPDASIDLVMTSFVLQQVPDRPAVLREIRRVLSPGGVVGIAGWLEEPEPFAPDAALEKALAQAGLTRLVSPDIRAGHYRSVRSAADELRAAGFKRVAARPDRLEHSWAIEDFIGYRTTTRDLGLFEGLDAPTRQLVIDELRDRLSRLEPDQLVNRAPVVSIVGRKA